MVKKRKFGMANTIMIKRKLLKKVLAEQARDFLGLQKLQKLKKLRHCIQYADDVKKGDTVTCKKLEFKNFHDYKKYRPSDCNKDMVNFFVKKVGTRNIGKSTSRIIQNMNNEMPYHNRRHAIRRINPQAYLEYLIHSEF